MSVLVVLLAWCRGLGPLLLVCILSTFQAETCEATLHEVHHVVLAEGLRSFEQPHQSKMTGEFDHLNHFSRVRDLVEYMDIAQVTVVDDLAEGLVVHLLLEVDDELLVLAAASCERRACCSCDRQSLVICLSICSSSVLQKELAQNLALASDDAHVGLDLDVATCSALGLPEIVDLLQILLLTLFSVGPRCMLRLVLTVGNRR